MMQRERLPMDDKEKETLLLLEEYRQLCEDWRARDKYILDKFVGSGVVFTLIGYAFTRPDIDKMAQLFMLAMGSFFTLVISISIANDIKFRDGTEKLLKFVSDKLGIDDLLPNLRYTNPKKSQLWRKITSAQNDSSLRLWGQKWPEWPQMPETPLLSLLWPLWLLNWLLHILKWLINILIWLTTRWFLSQHTFTWVRVFYLISFIAFLVLFVIVLAKLIYA